MFPRAGIGAVPIVDAEGRVVGIYSRSDITFLATAADPGAVLQVSYRNLFLSIALPLVPPPPLLIDLALACVPSCFPKPAACVKVPPFVHENTDTFDAKRMNE